MCSDAVPLYREDLPSDYIAYWQVEYGTEYKVISSGPDTGQLIVILHTHAQYIKIERGYVNPSMDLRT